MTNLVAADSIGQIDQVAAWLYRAARNEIVDRSRKIREYQIQIWDEADPELSEISQIMCDPEGTPEDMLLKKIFWEELAAALDEMPEIQREAFVKTEFEGLTFKELSQETGVPVSALLARKRRAASNLRSRLKEAYELILSP